MIAAVPPAAPPAVVQPIQRFFKDWLLVCDNGRRCVAKVIPASDETLAGLGMAVTREPGPAGKLALAIYTSDGKLDPKETVLDNTALKTRYVVDQDGSLTLAGEPALAFLRAIRSGGVLRGAHTDDGPVVSLDGFSAAMLAMDEAQGRIGTVTAVVRAGAKPASTVPLPPPLPVVQAAAPPPPLKNAAALAKAVRAGQAGALKAADCESGGNLPDDEAHPLNATEALVILGCGMGAYQGWSLAFRVPRAFPARAVLLRLPPAPSLERPSGSAGSYGEAEYDPKTATFSEHARGRGIGDCGVSTGWVFDGQAFHLSFHQEQTRCGGESPEWPTVFRTRIQPAG